MKTKILTILIILTVFSSTVEALPHGRATDRSVTASGTDKAGCGEMQPIYGFAMKEYEWLPGVQFPVAKARVVLYRDDVEPPIGMAMTNPFGYYNFGPVEPCGQYYVAIYDKVLRFEPAVQVVVTEDFPEPPTGVRVNFTAQIGIDQGGNR